jgi:hypothetical protein
VQHQEFFPRYATTTIAGGCIIWFCGLGPWALIGASIALVLSKSFLNELDD